MPHRGASQPTRILIADDQPIFRYGLHRLLEVQPGLVVVGEVVDGIDAVRVAGGCHPDVLLLNADAPRLAGAIALREMARQHRYVRTILLTAAIDESHAQSWLHLGARGLISKDSASDVLVGCIRAVMAGEYWIGQSAIERLGATLPATTASPAAVPAGATADDGPPTQRLTPRELEIVECIVAGCGNRDIADRFAISEHTVKHHLTRIFDKTGATSRLELAVLALKHWSQRGAAQRERSPRTA